MASTVNQRPQATRVALSSSPSRRFDSDAVVQSKSPVTGRRVTLTGPSLVGDWRAAQVAGIANASAGESESIIAIIEELQLTKPPGDDKKSVTRRSKCISTLRERTLSQLTFPRLARQMAPPSPVLRKARKKRRLRNA